MSFNFKFSKNDHGVPKFGRTHHDHFNFYLNTSIVSCCQNIYFLTNDPVKLSRR